MICEAVQGALSNFGSCEESESGARIPTHCLYPSFETVHVHIVRYGDGFKVHDGSGAFRCAWDHGRDAPMITRCLSREASRYHISVREGSLVADAPTIDWLGSAILSVCNASAAAANAAVAHFAAAAESDLADRINESLVREFTKKRVAREFLSRLFGAFKAVWGWGF